MRFPSKRLTPAAMLLCVWLTLAAASWAMPPAKAAATASSAAASSPSVKGQTDPVKKIDVNSASKKQLMTLPGIGDAEATRIVANRPYLSKTDIVFKAGIPEGTYLAIKRRIVAVQKPKSTAGKA